MASLRDRAQALLKEVGLEGSGKLASDVNALAEALGVEIGAGASIADKVAACERETTPTVHSDVTPTPRVSLTGLSAGALETPAPAETALAAAAPMTAAPEAPSEPTALNGFGLPTRPVQMADPQLLNTTEGAPPITVRKRQPGEDDATYIARLQETLKNMIHRRREEARVVTEYATAHTGITNGNARQFYRIDNPTTRKKIGKTVCYSELCMEHLKYPNPRRGSAAWKSIRETSRKLFKGQDPVHGVYKLHALGEGQKPEDIRGQRKRTGELMFFMEESDSEEEEED